MKKIIILSLLLVFVLPLTSVFAAESDDASYSQINMMLNSANMLSDSQFYQISDLSSDLSSMQKTNLFQFNKKSATVPFVVNFLVGFGIGSYIQGDKKGGNIALIGDLVSMGLYLSGFSASFNSLYNGGTYDAGAGAGMLLLGGIGLLATRIFEMVRPFSFASDYNKKLSNSLMSFAIVPIVNSNKDMKIGLIANIEI